MTQWFKEKRAVIILTFVAVILGIIIAGSSNPNDNSVNQAPNQVSPSIQQSPIEKNATGQNLNTANNIRSVVNIICDDGSGGSGTVMTNDGIVVTNNHVVSKANKCLVTIPDQETGQPDKIYVASPIIIPKLSEQYDIAMLNIDSAFTDSDGKKWGDYPTVFPAFTRPPGCEIYSPQLDDSITIYGYPVTSGGYNIAVTHGNISSFSDNGMILTDAKVDSGNSGGLAVSQNGCMVGIPSAVQKGNYQNFGVIIPSSIILDFFSKIPT